MATVNLSWTVEGLHDGIRVERSFMNDGMPHTDYLDTLPAGTTEFEDDFSISELADHYGGILVEDLDLLTYTLTTFRGDKEKSTKVPVPIEDTELEWVQNLDIPGYSGQMEPLNVDILTSDYKAAIDTSMYGSDGPLVICFAGSSDSYALLSRSGDYSPYSPDFDFTQLHDLNFTRMLNAQFNNTGSAPLMTDVIIGSLESPFEYETYPVSFYTEGDLPDYSLNFNHELFITGDSLPEYFFLSAPYVSSDSGNNSRTTGMAINVYITEVGHERITAMPWTPELHGVYVYLTGVSLVRGLPGLPA